MVVGKAAITTCPTYPDGFASQSDGRNTRDEPLLSSTHSESWSWGSPSAPGVSFYVFTGPTIHLLQNYDDNNNNNNNDNKNEQDADDFISIAPFHITILKCAEAVQILKCKTHVLRRSDAKTTHEFI